MAYYLPTSSIVAALTFLLGLITFLANKNSKLNISFGLASVFAALWVMALYFSDQWKLLDSGSILLFNRLSIVLGILWGGTFIYTVAAFPNGNIKNKFAIYVTLFVTIAFVPITLFTNLIVAGFTTYSGGTNLVMGSYYWVYGLWMLGLLVYFIVTSSIKLRQASSSIEKIQLWYLVAGLITFATATALFNLILPSINGNYSLSRFGSYSIIALVVSTSYAITKHKLFNVKVILAEITALILVLINTLQIFTASSTQEAIFWVVVVIVVAIVGYLFVRSVQGEISRREEVERLAAEKTGALAELEQRNKNLATLQKVSEIVMNETDMKQMTQHILDEFPKQMDGCIGALLNIVKDDRLIPYTFSENELTKKIRGVIGDDLEKYSQPLKKGFNLLHDSLLEQKQIASESLADFISPPIPKPIALTVQRLIGAKSFVSMPLYAGGVPFGVMLFVFSATEGSVHEKNLNIAKSIADEMSLAVQRAQAFQKLKEANEYLQQLDKMKDEFISMASHELNTPLAAIEGYLSMILDEGMGKVDAKSKEYLTRAYDSSKRLAALILDLLNVSRIEQGRLKMKFAQSNMIDLAESVIKELQIKSDAKKIYLKVEGDKKTLPLTWCDPDRIRQVLVNLAGNAIKFTEKGGVTIKVTGDKDFVHVAVTDTGRGIAAEDQKLLFGKFSQVKRDVDEHQGTGLGLYISKNYIELHQGKIWVDSEAGKGATFKFDLPVIDKPPLEVKGAVLENAINAPQIELRNEKEIPQYIANAKKEMAAAAAPAEKAALAEKPVAASANKPA